LFFRAVEFFVTLVGLLFQTRLYPKGYF